MSNQIADSCQIAEEPAAKRGKFPTAYTSSDPCILFSLISCSQFPGSMKDMQSCRDMLRQHMIDCRRDIDEIKERISNLEQILEEDRRARDRVHHAETINQIARRRQAMIRMGYTGAQQQQQGDAPSAGENFQCRYFPKQLSLSNSNSFGSKHKGLLIRTLHLETVVHQMMHCCMP